MFAFFSGELFLDLKTCGLYESSLYSVARLRRALLTSPPQPILRVDYSQNPGVNRLVVSEKDLVMGSSFCTVLGG